MPLQVAAWLQFVERVPGMAVAVSFSSSGLLFPYHLGVVEAMQRLPEAKKLDIGEVHGVSGGALAGAVLLLGSDCLEQVRLALRTQIRPTWGEIWDPASLLPRLLKEHDILPDDAFTKLSGRLFVHTTTGGMMRNTKTHRISAFGSNEELVKALQASCSFAWDGVEIDGVPHWDGGCSGLWDVRSDNLPTIASSPIFKKSVEICPRPGRGFDVWGFRVDSFSLRAGWDITFMFSPLRMAMYWQLGLNDANTFLSSL